MEIIESANIAQSKLRFVRWRFISGFQKSMAKLRNVSCGICAVGLSHRIVNNTATLYQTNAWHPRYCLDHIECYAYDQNATCMDRRVLIPKMFDHLYSQLLNSSIRILKPTNLLSRNIIYFLYCLLAMFAQNSSHFWTDLHRKPSVYHA